MTSNSPSPPTILDHDHIPQPLNSARLSLTTTSPSGQNSSELPVTHGLSSSPSSSPSSSSTLVQNRPRRRPIPKKGHKKSRLGCFNCKRRRVKCPETLPSCEPCQRLGLRCSYPPNQCSGSDLVPRPSPGPLLGGPGRALSQTSLSMSDLQFFHHFLLHAYPGLPIRGEKVWREVAQYSHGFDFLAHAMLALGASHLALCTAKDYNSPALTHRITAINSLNEALNHPCQSKEESDARYATLMALTFQSSYMQDGMYEFISMLRGCSVVADSSQFRFKDSAFRTFSTEGHVQRVVEINGGFDTGFSDTEGIDTGLASLRAIAPLSKSVLEINFVSRLQRVLQMARTSTIGAFSEICRAYELFTGATASEFRAISDPENHVAQVIICHFFVIEYVLATVALAPVSPSFPFRSGIVTAWIQRAWRQVPDSYRVHVEWPLEFISRSSSDWGTNLGRPGILEEIEF